MQKPLNEYSRSALEQILENMNNADIAAELAKLDEKEAVKVFRALPKDRAADVFSYLSSDIQQDVIEGIADREIGGIIDELFLDDAVDFVEDMPEDVLERVLANIKPERREMIHQFMQYPEDSAGSIMTVEFVELTDRMTVADAFAHIQEVGPDKETIYTCYVIDIERRLTGMVSARTLLLADPADTIGNIMEPNVIRAHVDDDREALVNGFRKYGFIAMPVVDNEEHLVGIVTFDDVFEAQEEEATEDFEKMAAMSPSEEPYLRTGVMQLTKNRIFWLLLLMVSAAFTGGVVEKYEAGLAMLPALVTFIPMLMNTGGNAGSQSATLIIRGMALEEIKLSDAFKIFCMEMLISTIVGGALFVVTYVCILVRGEGSKLALTVCLALYATVFMSNFIGGLLPFAAKSVKIDPAVMASPVLTTIVDAAALIVYFRLAAGILHI